jgi:hypothetical protein
VDVDQLGWRADREQALVSVLIAETRDDVTALNVRARADLILDGSVRPWRSASEAVFSHSFSNRWTSTSSGASSRSPTREQALVSVLIAETRDDVTALNVRARADLILDGTLKPGREVELNDGTTAGVGDTGSTIEPPNLRPVLRVVTEPSSRTSMMVQVSPLRTQSLPLRNLGYAITAHRAQGVTVDTAHVLVEPTTTRENFYVAMTRGKQSNQPRTTPGARSSRRTFVRSCGSSRSRRRGHR